MAGDMQLLKFGLVVVSIGGTTYAFLNWKNIDENVRWLIIAVLVVTLVASIPGFVDGIKYIVSLLPEAPPSLPEAKQALEPTNVRLARFIFGLSVREAGAIGSW
jgi:hypothetical protein